MSPRPAGRLAGIAFAGIVVAACSSSGAGASGAEPSTSIRPAPSISFPATVPPRPSTVTGEVPDAVMTAVQADLSTRTGKDATTATVVTAEAVVSPTDRSVARRRASCTSSRSRPAIRSCWSSMARPTTTASPAQGTSVRLCEGLKPAGSG